MQRSHAVLAPKLFGDFGSRSDRFGGNAALCKRHTVKSRNAVMGHMARNQGNPIKCDALKSPPPIHCTTPESSAQSGSTELGHGSGVWRGLSGTRFRDVACL